MSLRRGAAGLAIVALASACSGTEASRAPVKASPSATATPRAKLPYPSPARWVVHPYPPTIAAATLRLAGGGCLLVERNGQRWTTHPALEKPAFGMIGMMGDYAADDVDPGYEPAPWTPPSGCTGVGVAAMERMPEEVIDIVRWPGAYGFVGQSGVVHVARWPLGPIVQRIPPPEPLLRVKSTGGAMIAIASTGRVYRWEEATGYERVDLGPFHALDVAVGPSGRAAILAAPEALFTTEDAGRHFQRADAPSIGAQRIAIAESGRILVEGVVSSLAWDPHEPASFTLGSENLVERTLDIAIESGRRASASNVSQGRAAIDGDTYWESNLDDYGDWSLYRGKIDGAITEVRIPDPPSRDDTVNVLPAANGKHVAIAVTRWEGRSVVELRVSHDGARTFGPKTPLTIGDGSQVALAVSSEGTVLLTGVCPEAERAPRDDVDLDIDEGEDRGCAGGPLIVRPDGAIAQPSATLSEGPALSPAFSIDGRSAYFLGAERGGGRAALYVSRDGGATFEERALETDTEESRITLSATEDTNLSVSEDGTVGAVFNADGDIEGTVYVTTDADGKNLHVSEPPEKYAVLGGFGARVIALLRPPAYNADAAVLSESTDGGKSWFDVPAPQMIREGYFRRGQVQCSAVGCLVGEDAVRIGWGAGRDTSVPFEPPEPPAPDKPLRTTIVCEPRPGSTWTAIENPQGALLPAESEAMRGASAWMIPTIDPETGEVSAVSASIPEKPGAESRIATKRVLDPVPKKKPFALAMRPQIEGFSLARVAVDAGDEDPQAALAGRHIRDLEIAWENLEEGTTGHGRIDDAGTYGRYTVAHTGARYMRLDMGILSVSPRGIFVRARDEGRAVFFVDTKGKVQRIRYPEWPTEILGGGSLTSGDMVNVDGTFVVTADFRVVGQDTPEILFLMRPPGEKAKPGDPWTPWSALLAPPTDYARGRFTRSDWTYEGGHLAVWTLHTVPASAYATAWMRRVQADGTLAAPRRVPTPYDLGAMPRACTAAEHKDLPRLKFPLDRWGRFELAGVRHAVLVHDPSEPPPPPPPTSELDPEGKPTAPAAPSTTVTSRPVYPAPSTVPMGERWMISTGLVMRGDATTACLDGLVASSVDDWDHAMMVAGDLSFGWYFRLAQPLPVKKKKTDEKEPDPWPAPTGPPPAPRLEARPLTCHYDPAVPVPGSVVVVNRNR